MKPMTYAAGHVRHEFPRSSSRVLQRDQSPTVPNVPDTTKVHARQALNDPQSIRIEVLRERCAHYAGLVLASMLGCLIRLGLDAMGAYQGQVIFELAWAQGVGCGIMGLALYRKKQIDKLYPPLYTFITTGLAGSVTTFSGWMLGGYQSFSNMEAYERGGFFDAVDGVAYTFSTMAIAIGCLYWGEHVSKCLPSVAHIASATHRATSSGNLPTSESVMLKDTARGSPSDGKREESQLTPRAALLLDYAMILSAVLSYLIALLVYFLGPAYWRHRATLPILLSPPGAMIRFQLSSINSRPTFSGKFPLGTFIANMAGTLITGGVFAAEHLPSSLASTSQCNALWAIQQGFCGCLTTVSTFVVEARSIKGKRWSWAYVGSSVSLGHLAILVTFGLSKRAGNIGSSVCSA